MSEETKPLPEILDGIRTALKSLPASGAGGDSRVTQTQILMHDVFELGITVSRDPTLKDSVEVTGCLAETADALRHAIIDIKAFVRATEYHLQDTWYADEWRWTCIRRSGLEFLKELYRNTSFGEYLVEFDLADLDELLKQRGEVEGFLSNDKIPTGVPKLHWWWWYPNEPPEE